MKKRTMIFGSILSASLVLLGCDETTTTNNQELIANESEIEDDSEDFNSDEIADESESDINVELIDANSYENYTFDKKYTEEPREKDFFDRRDRENDEMIKVEFSDGHFGSIVYREGFWYNYSIREKTEYLFATKDDALQYAYDQSKLLQDAGASIASMVMKKSGPLKKDGTPDMRYSENQ